MPPMASCANAVETAPKPRKAANVSARKSFMIQLLLVHRIAIENMRIASPDKLSQARNVVAKPTYSPTITRNKSGRLWMLSPGTRRWPKLLGGSASRPTSVLGLRPVIGCTVPSVNQRTASSHPIQSPRSLDSILTIEPSVSARIYSNARLISAIQQI
jgi:hypothetical protein